MTPSRTKLPLVLAGVALGGLALLGWTQSWFALTLDGGQQLAVDGQAAAPGLSALGLACLALAGALAIAGRIPRLVLGFVETLIGVGVVVTAVSAIAHPVAASASAITAATAVSGAQSLEALVTAITITGWPWLSAVTGALISVVGIAVIVLSPRWPGSSRKYDSPETVDSRDSSTPSGVWDSLSGGSDPTSR